MEWPDLRAENSCKMTSVSPVVIIKKQVGNDHKFKLATTPDLLLLSMKTAACGGVCVWGRGGGGGGGEGGLYQN